MRGLEQIPWLYDASMRLFPGIHRWRLDIARRAEGHILEIGCGTGLMLPLYGAGTTVTAIEPNDPALHRARDRGPTVRLLNASAEALPFTAGVFDCVVSSLVFCSIPDPTRALEEIRRVLRPGGRLHMLEHVQAQGALGAAFFDRVQPVWTSVTGGCHPNRDTEALVQAAGFTIIETDRRSRGLMRLFTAVP